MTVDDTEQHSYTYDVLYQLIDVNYPVDPNIYYYYDKLGNRTSVENGGTTSYASNKLNQYTSVGGINYSYDDNGNLTDINDGQFEYIYDCENRLIEAKENSQTVATYAYDYLGRRVGKTVGATVTTYCYDGDHVIFEYEGGSKTGFFIYGVGIDEPMYMYISGMPAGHYCHFDGLGSVIALSNYNGDIAERYSYDVFGEPTIRDSELSVSSVALKNSG